MPGLPKNQQALARFNQVLNDINGAVDGPPHTAGEAHDMPAAVANGRDAVQRALQPGAVIRVKISDARHHKINIGTGDFIGRQHQLPI